MNAKANQKPVTATEQSPAVRLTPADSAGRRDLAGGSQAAAVNESAAAAARQQPQADRHGDMAEIQQAPSPAASIFGPSIAPVPKSSVKRITPPTRDASSARVVTGAQLPSDDHQHASQQAVAERSGGGCAEAKAPIQVEPGLLDDVDKAAQPESPVSVCASEMHVADAGTPAGGNIILYPLLAILNVS